MDPYSVIPFESRPSPERHPHRFSVLASLFGVPKIPLEGARFLEIGCSTGRSLLALAESLPKTHFVGFDRNASQIAVGQDALAAIGLTNVQLVAKGLEEIELDRESFDFVLCHGLYSWTSRKVSHQALRLASEVLKPSGVCYFSFNSLPGFRPRQALRDVVLLYDDESEEPAKRIERARKILKQTEAELYRDHENWTLSLRSEIAHLEARSDSFLLHELLAPETFSLSIEEFLANANECGLKFIYEADPKRFPRVDTSGFGRAIETDGTLCRKRRLVLSDQFSPNAFRGLILTKQGVELEEEPVTAVVREMFISSSLVPVEEPPDVTSSRGIEFRAPDESSVRIRKAHLKAAVVFLRGFWPQAVSFSELVNAARELSGTEIAQEELEEDIESFCVKFFLQGNIDLFRGELGCAQRIPEKAAVSALTRHQVTRANWVCTQRHEYVPISVFESKLLPLLDGTRTVQQLESSLLELASKGELGMKQEGKVIESKEAQAEILREQLGTSLQMLREHGLLTS